MALHSTPHHALNVRLVVTDSKYQKVLAQLDFHAEALCYHVLHADVTREDDTGDTVSNREHCVPWHSARLIGCEKIYCSSGSHYVGYDTNCCCWRRAWRLGRC